VVTQTDQQKPRSPLLGIPMPGREFRLLSELIHARCGIKMPPSKKTMLESRLMKRLRVLGMDSYKRYCDYLLSPEGMENELVHMIDVVTTNKTDFFREPEHFSFLLGRVVPEIYERYRRQGVEREIRIWSAGCSTGEEPYSLAMALEEYASNNRCPGCSILATDISTSVLARAEAGVYDYDKTEPVPMEMLKKYFLKSSDPEQRLVMAGPFLKERVRFRRLNFMDAAFGMRERFDVIFCRNVLIYFDKKTQEAMINRLCQHIYPGGYLFIGRSETLTGMDTPLSLVVPTVYRIDR